MQVGYGASGASVSKLWIKTSDSSYLGEFETSPQQTCIDFEPRTGGVLILLNIEVRVRYTDHL